MNTDTVVFGLTVFSWLAIAILILLSAACLWTAAWLTRPMYPRRKDRLKRRKYLRKYRDARRDEHADPDHLGIGAS